MAKFKYAKWRKPKRNFKKASVRGIFNKYRRGGTFALKRRSFSKSPRKYYMCSLRCQGEIAKIRLPCYGYIKVTNVQNKREFFARSDRANAYPPPAFITVGYDADTYGRSVAGQVIGQ